MACKRACTWHVRGMYVACTWHVRVCTWHVRGMYVACTWHVRRTCHVHAMYMPRTCPIHTLTCHIHATYMPYYRRTCNIHTTYISRTSPVHTTYIHLTYPDTTRQRPTDAATPWQTWHIGTSCWRTPRLHSRPGSSCTTALEDQGAQNRVLVDHVETTVPKLKMTSFPVGHSGDHVGLFRPDAVQAPASSLLIWLRCKKNTIEMRTLACPRDADAACEMDPGATASPACARRALAMRREVARLCVCVCVHARRFGGSRTRPHINHRSSIA